MRILFFVLTSSILTSCAVIGPGEVGVKQKLGKLKGGVAEEGIRVYNPFIAKYLKVPIRTNNMKVNLEIPSKEGLTIRSEMSILYHIEKEKAVEVIREIGLNYEEDLIAPVFRSALADVSARFMAKDMHTGQRAVIEKEVKERMMEVLGERGVVIESVLMKRIELPASLSSAIESKLSAEQEAERRRIEARGVRDAQKILDEGLTDAVLKFKALETFRELSQSNNSKVIFYNGEVPLMLQPEAASD